MRRATSVLVIIAMLLALLPALAGVPDFVTYSGRLTDGTAWGKSTTLDLTFRVYGSADVDDMLWQKEYPGLAVEDGYFSVLLGDGDNPTTPEVETDYNVTDIFAANDETWITVCIGEDCSIPGSDLSPRQQIGSVPYAMLAERATQAGDFKVSGSLGVGTPPLPGVVLAASGVVKTGGLYTATTGSLGNLAGGKSATVATIETSKYSVYIRVIAFAGNGTPCYIEKVYRAYASNGNFGSAVALTVLEQGTLGVSFQSSYQDGGYFVTVTVTNNGPDSSGLNTQVIIEAAGVVSLQLE